MSVVSHIKRPVAKSNKQFFAGKQLSASELYFLISPHVFRQAGPPQSKFWFRSPCYFARSVDFTVHVVGPTLLCRRAPKLAAWLLQTSPRWRCSEILHHMILNNSKD